MMRFLYVVVAMLGLQTLQDIYNLGKGEQKQTKIYGPEAYMFSAFLFGVLTVWGISVILGAS